MTGPQVHDEAAVEFAVKVVHALRFTAVPFSAACVAELAGGTGDQAAAAIRHGQRAGWIAPSPEPSGSWVGAHREGVR